MKNMKMKKIVAALGTVVALASVATVAQADTLLFPVYRVGNGQFSFLSLNTITTPNTIGPMLPGGAGVIHYTWNWKIPDATGNIGNNDKCTHEDAPGKMTAFDLIQQTVESPTLAGGNLLNLSTIFTDASGPAYSLQAPAVGFMTVTNGNTVESDFFGQMVLIDAATGIVTAYKGLNNPASVLEGTFNSILTSKTIFNTTWYPTTEAGSSLGAAGVDTAWYATVTGGLAPTNAMHLPSWAGAGTFQNAIGSTFNVWNRDEGPRSGLKATTVTCFGLFHRADWMTSAQATHTANGGIEYLRFIPTPGTNSTGTLLTKIEATTALGSKKTLISSENSFPNLPY